jgi:hypothetical protein
MIFQSLTAIEQIQANLLAHYLCSVCSSLSQ